MPYYFSCAYGFARILSRSIVKSLEYACCDPEGKRIKLKQEQHCILGFLDHRVRLKIAVSDYDENPVN